MANKLVDREGLKAFRQALQTKLEQGGIVVGKSLSSKQLENVSEESGSTQTKPFIFQGTGTDSNTTETPTAPVAKHLELRGNTVVFNQLLDGNFTSKTENGVTFTNNNDGSLTISTAEGGATADVSTNERWVLHTQGHKYLIKGVNNLDETGVLFRCSSGSYTVDKETIYSRSGSTNNNSISIFVPSGTELASPITIYPQFIDLTLMFGAGNEPTTVEEFNRLFGLPHYAYNAGELMSCRSSSLVTVGYNACEGFEQGGIGDSTGQDTYPVALTAIRSLGYIRVIPGQTYKIDGYDTVPSWTNGLYLYLYREDKTFIERIWRCNSNNTESTIEEKTAYTIPAGVGYIRISFNNYPNTLTYDDSMKISFHLKWDDSRTGYEPYWKKTYALPDIELRSAGSVYDEIKSNGTKITRIGIIDLGTLNWDYQSGNQRFVSYNSFGQKGVSSNTVVGNILCAKYETVSQSNSGVLTKDKTIAVYLDSTPYLYIADSNYTDAVSLKAALSGVYLFYELSEPIESQESSFAENIEVDDFGTMEFVGTAVPQGNKFFYPADYVLLIDDLNRYVNGAIEELALKSDLSSIDLTGYLKKTDFNAMFSETGIYIEEE